MHVVVVGCGRVGSELAGSLEQAGHTVAVIDKNAARVPAPARRLRRASTVVGFGFDRDHLVEAGIERAGAFAAVTSGDNSNILARPHRPRELRHRARRRPHLRPPPGADLPAARHPDRRDRRRGPPTRCCAGSCPSEEQPHDWLDPSGKVCLVERPDPGQAGRARSSRRSSEPGRVLARRGHPPRRRRRSCTPSAIGQEGDVLHFVADVSRARRAARAHSSTERSTDARRDRRRRQRRALHRQRPRRAPATRCCSSSSSPTVVRARRGRPTASSGTSPTRARSTSLREAGLERCDVVVAATGDDEDNLVISLLAKQEFAVPRVIARVNHPKNEWLFNENWGVDLSVSTPHLITALVEEAVTVGRLVRILQFEGGQARLVEVTLADDSPVVDQAISRPRRPPRRHDRRGRARRARRDAARRHGLRGRRRGARDGHPRLRGRGPPDPHRRLTA